MASGWRQGGVRMASGMVHICVRKRQAGVRMASRPRQQNVKTVSGWPQDGIRMASGKVRIVQLRQERVRMRQDGVRMASGWRQDGVRMREDGVRQASEVCQGRGVAIGSASGCVKKASGWRR